MALKFSPNLSTMFTEVPFLDRFEKARESGFSTFEIQNPYDFEPEKIKQKQGVLVCDLINIYCDSPFGCAALPVHEEEFYNATQRVMPYYYSLNFRKLHILSGETCPDFSKDDHVQTLIQSLNSLVSSDYLENINVTGLIEPIAGEVNEKYFLNSFDTALEVIKAVNSDQIKLLLDIYHLHKITGDVKKFLEIYYPYAGHIQVSQDPGRREPFYKGGVIDYAFVFDYLRQNKHTDAIGLEYFPSGSTVESLEWIKTYNV